MQDPESLPSKVEGTSNGLTAASKVYHAMVVDSGPIIKETNIRKWIGTADRFYTVPAVIDEIRDAKARYQLEQNWIPLLGLEVKVPSTLAIQRVTEFAKLTGDYPSLSSTDIQVLALVVDLELEGCFSLEHLRSTPKRTIGLGSIIALNKGSAAEKQQQQSIDGPPIADNECVSDVLAEDDDDSDDDDSEGSADSIDDGSSKENSDLQEQDVPQPLASVRTPPSSWAKLVSPTEGSATVQIDSDLMTTNIITPLKSLKVVATTDEGTENDGGTIPSDGYDLAKDLESDFPSLASAATVPYEDDDLAVPVDSEQNESSTMESIALHPEEGETATEARLRRLQEEDLERERLKQEALKPISKSGKLYNSFRNYKDLIQPGPAKLGATAPKENIKVIPVGRPAEDDVAVMNPDQSRILGSGGSAAFAGPIMKAEDDDGEGWITSTQHMGALKSLAGGGRLDPIRTGTAILSDIPGDVDAAEQEKKILPQGPLINERTACVTTDFAMQNVLLQMGLILLSVDGMQIRRLKSWVLRCAACFKIHTDPFDSTTGMRRLFCAHCGSDYLQRVSASVDGKTGRLKLYFSTKKRNKFMNTRGTKFSLPKPGTGNRFQGDLLLREDQLLMGAWQQKVKKNMGGQSRAHTESLFGKDIASNVGCGVTSMPNDIQVGFGKRNPNAVKGRERRGKKKKSSDRACGLRRY